jgi:hypothetical protein
VKACVQRRDGTNFVFQEVAIKARFRMPKTPIEIREMYQKAAKACSIDPDRLTLDFIHDSYTIELQGGTQEEFEALEAEVDVLFSSSYNGAKRGKP